MTRKLWRTKVSEEMKERNDITKRRRVEVAGGGKKKDNSERKNKHGGEDAIEKRVFQSA